MTACFCIGPQNGNTLCPCALRNLPYTRYPDTDLVFLRRRVQELERELSKERAKNRGSKVEPFFPLTFGFKAS